jgi:hypothetical protein
MEESRIYLKSIRELELYNGIIKLIKNDNRGDLVFVTLLQMSIECYICKCTDGSGEKFVEIAKLIYEELDI